MVRPVLLLFTKDNEMKNSLARFIRYVGTGVKGLKHEFDLDPKSHTGTYSFIEEITSILDKMPYERLRHTTAILDMSGGEQDNSWDPVSTNAILTLMYPDVYWIFVGMKDNLSSEEIQWDLEHFVDPLDKTMDIPMDRLLQLLELHQQGYLPLFDPSGLRTWVKGKALKQESVNCCERKEKAAAIDEEDVYVYMHGYIAYKMGYGCYTVATEGMMASLFDSKEKKEGKEKTPLTSKVVDLSFEDVFINFPDKPSDVHLSDLRNRDKNFDKLKAVKTRIFVTVNHKHINWYDDNSVILNNIFPLISRNKLA